MVWVGAYLVAVGLHRRQGRHRVVTPDEFIAAACNFQVSLDTLHKMIPHLHRESIEDVRRINEAAIARDPSLLTAIQMYDHDPIY